MAGDLYRKLILFLGDLCRKFGKARLFFLFIFGILGCISYVCLLKYKTALWIITFLISLVCFFLSCSWEYGLFALSFIICCLFILCPLFLFDPVIKNLVSSFLSELMSSDYKATYIEALASMLGAFLAIAGALSVERHIKDKADEEQDVFNARIIYYDLHFAFKQIRELLEKSNLGSAGNNIQSPSHYHQYSTFANQLNSYLVLIDKDWIRTISALPESKISEQEREHLYQLYDMICNIRRAIENCPKKFNNKDAPWNDVYKRMYNFSAIAPSEHRPTCVNYTLTQQQANQREATENVWKTLKKQAKIR